MAQLALVPRPTAFVEREGVFVLDRSTTLAGPEDWCAATRRLLTPGTGCNLTTPVELPAGITIIANSSLPPEGYRLDVAEAGIRIEASDLRGVNWAVQTLRQLLPVTIYAAAPLAEQFEIPAVSVVDSPRFAWRGMMLDVGRHFVPYPHLLTHIDLLAQHKFNVFHLHLTEDQGWRFASERYPKLAQQASWRTETKNPAWQEGDGTPHGGYYTPDQLRALVVYAAQRGITVVPEIEFPGHVQAFLAAYPEYGNHPEKPVAAATTWGVKERVLNMSDDALAVVFDLYAELLKIFPSVYIHVGGDECPRNEWLESAQAQNLAARRGLPDAGHLQRWFTEQLRDWLAARGRRLVGWDEIHDDGPLPGAVVMAWRSVDKGISAAAAGHDVIMAPTSHTYFDFYPSSDDSEPYSIGDEITVEQAYAFDPLEGIPEEQHQRILGTQCQIWTEFMPDMARMEYMLWPRACAHSEVAWSAARDREWSEFEGRLGRHLERLSMQGVNFRPLDGPLPWQKGGTGHWRRPGYPQPLGEIPEDPAA